MDTQLQHSQMTAASVPSYAAQSTTSSTTNGDQAQKLDILQNKQSDDGTMVVDAGTSTDDLYGSAPFESRARDFISTAASAPRSMGILVVDKTALQHSPTVKTARLHAAQISLCRRALRVCSRDSHVNSVLGFVVYWRFETIHKGRFLQMSRAAGNFETFRSWPITNEFLGLK
jgi:hypothetical protein